MNWTASPASPGSSSCAWQQSWSSVKSRSGLRPGADLRIASDVWAYRFTAPCTARGHVKTVVNACTAMAS